MSASKPLRVGIVPYLNMLPLTYGMDSLCLDGSESLSVVSVPPSRMAEMMDRAELDIGMVPVGALVNRLDWRIIGAPSGASMIGSRGKVRSVLAISDLPPEEWKVLHPDSHSRSSNALVQILLKNCLRLQVEIGSVTPLENWEPTREHEPNEAFLLIGTRALRWRDSWPVRDGAGQPHILDLGELWTQWTGLPFAFAVWAMRPGINAAEARITEWMEKFEELKRTNLSRLDAIIAQWPGENEERLTPELAREYLTQNIKFDLSEEALKGLERYYLEGLSLGIFQPGWNLDTARAY